MMNSGWKRQRKISDNDDDASLLESTERAGYQYHDDVKYNEEFGVQNLEQRRREPDDISADCYNEVLCDNHEPPIVRTSWMKNLQWISSTNNYVNVNNYHNRNTTMTIPICCNHVDARDSTSKEAWNDVRNELKHLSMQLGLVKRRFTHSVAEQHDSKNEYTNHNCSYHNRCNPRKNNKAPTKKRSTDAGAANESFEYARRECNPFEILSEWRDNGMNSELFMNRSAMKLANIDAVLGFILVQSLLPTTSEMYSSSQPNISSTPEFVFVDLCGAPGGFSEYLLWRCSGHDSSRTSKGSPSRTVHGYGMSLVGKNEQGYGTRWKLRDENWTSVPEVDEEWNTNEAINGTSFYKICYGADGTGDIYKWNNIVYLKQFIQFYSSSVGGSSSSCYDNDTSSSSINNTDNTNNDEGIVNLVVADGGFDAQRNVEDQEQVSQKLVVCETLCALKLLKLGGIYILKVFGCQTRVVRAVVTYLYYTFQQIMLIKPITSRPASAERYLCCYNFLGNPTAFGTGQSWMDAMFLGNTQYYNDLIRRSDLTTTSNKNLATQQQQKSNSAHNNATSSALDHFNLYVDTFDRDMYQLNLKACFAILTSLQQRDSSGTATTTNSHMDAVVAIDEDQNNDSSSDNCTAMEYNVDMDNKSWCITTRRRRDAVPVTAASTGTSDRCRGTTTIDIEAYKREWRLI